MNELFRKIANGLKPLLFHIRSSSRLRIKKTRQQTTFWSCWLTLSVIKRQSYLCSEETSDLKYNLAKEIIENHDVFNGYKQTETYKKATYNAKQENDKRLQQLERLGQLEQLQQLQKLNKIKSTNKSYHDFSEVSGAILYLDPPYEGSNQKGYTNSFDSQEFYDWAFEIAKTNIVIISSYSISDERFEAVYSFDKARSTLQGGENIKAKNEKLFMVKNISN